MLMPLEIWVNYFEVINVIIKANINCVIVIVFVLISAYDLYVTFNHLQVDRILVRR